MSAKNKKSASEKLEQKNSTGHDWLKRKQNLELRINALRKIIDKLKEEDKNK